MPLIPKQWPRDGMRPEYSSIERAFSDSAESSECSLTLIVSLCARMYVCVLGKRMIMAGSIPRNTRVEFYLLKGATEISGIELTRADIGDHFSLRIVYVPRIFSRFFFLLVLDNTTRQLWTTTRQLRELSYKRCGITNIYALTNKHWFSIFNHVLNDIKSLWHQRILFYHEIYFCNLTLLL